MSSVGKMIWCYQKFPSVGLTETPFKGKIVTERNQYWIVDVRHGNSRSISLQVLKAACSFVNEEWEAREGTVAKKESSTEKSQKGRRTQPAKKTRYATRNP